MNAEHAASTLWDATGTTIERRVTRSPSRYARTAGKICWLALLDPARRLPYARGTVVGTHKSGACRTSSQVRDPQLRRTQRRARLRAAATAYCRLSPPARACRRPGHRSHLHSITTLPSSTSHELSASSTSCRLASVSRITSRLCDRDKLSKYTLSRSPRSACRVLAAYHPRACLFIR